MTALIQNGVESGAEDIARAAKIISVTLSTFATIVQLLLAPVADKIGSE